MRQFSENGKKFLTLREGIRYASYLDSGGEPTIGVGHLLTHAERLSGKIKIAGKYVDYRHGLSDMQVEYLLDQDLVPAILTVLSLVKVPLTQNQFDALVSFVFNIGEQAFADSTLLRVLNNSEYARVPHEMRRWVYDDGIIVPGLKNRREKEIELWNGGVEV